MVLALLVSLLAGLATSVGGGLVVRQASPNRAMASVGLAFAAGAMILISLVQVVPLGIEYMVEATSSERMAMVVVWSAFFVGIGVVLIIDRLLHNPLNPSETEGAEDLLGDDATVVTQRIMRSGLLTALVLGLHNFPEGMATFLTTYQDPNVGITLAIAIAIHNIPEGVAVALPVFAATGSRSRAWRWATVSGLTEPLGGLVAAGILTWISAQLLGVFYGLVAGMMVFLALDELLPGSWRYQTDKHQPVYGMLAGMAVMALSFVFFASP